MVNLNLPDNSKITPGKTHGVDGQNKIVFNIYRWNREDNKNPRVDKYFVDKKKLGPMTVAAPESISSAPNIWNFENLAFINTYEVIIVTGIKD